MSGRRFGLWTGMEPPASPDVGGQPACSPIVHQPGTALRLLPQRPGCGWGICGALLTNASAFLSGAWLDLDLVGGGFARFARLLPFSHGVDAGRAALAGDLAQLPVHLAWVSGWALTILVLAIAAYCRSLRHI